MFFCSSIAFLLVRILKVVKPVNMPRRDYMRKVMPIGELENQMTCRICTAWTHLYTQCPHC